MSLSLRYFIVCESASLDHKQRLTCQSMYDCVHAEHLPNKIEKCTVALGIDGIMSGESANLRITIYSPEEEVIYQHDFEDSSRDDISPFIHLFNFNGLPIYQYGNYVITVEHISTRRIETIGRFPIRILRSAPI